MNYDNIKPLWAITVTFVCLTVYFHLCLVSNYCLLLLPLRDFHLYLFSSRLLSIDLPVEQIALNEEFRRWSKLFLLVHIFLYSFFLISCSFKFPYLSLPYHFTLRFGAFFIDALQSKPRNNFQKRVRKYEKWYIHLCILDYGVPFG